MTNDFGPLPETKVGGVFVHFLPVFHFLLSSLSVRENAPSLSLFLSLSLSFSLSFSLYLSLSATMTNGLSLQQNNNRLDFDLQTVSLSAPT